MPGTKPKKVLLKFGKCVRFGLSQSKEGRGKIETPVIVLVVCGRRKIYHVAPSSANKTEMSKLIRRTKTKRDVLLSQSFTYFLTFIRWDSFSLAGLQNTTKQFESSDSTVLTFHRKEYCNSRILGSMGKHFKGLSSSTTSFAKGKSSMVCGRNNIQVSKISIFVNL